MHGSKCSGFTYGSALRMRAATSRIVLAEIMAWWWGLEPPPGLAYKVGMFRLAHFSDIHLGPLPDVTYRELASKRITGYINWHRSRRGSYHHSIVEAIVDDMAHQAPDHVALTGDLVNLALDKEIEAAGSTMEVVSFRVMQ